MGKTVVHMHNTNQSSSHSCKSITKHTSTVQSHHYEKIHTYTSKFHEGMLFKQAKNGRKKYIKGDIEAWDATISASKAQIKKTADANNCPLQSPQSF